MALLAGVTASLASGASASASGAAAASVSLQLMWQHALPDGRLPVALSSPSVVTLDGAGPSVVVGDRSGLVHALHLSDGSVVAGWPASTPGRVGVDSTPSSSGSTVFVGVGTSANQPAGGYEAFAANGQPKWFTKVPNSPLTPIGTAGVASSLAVGNLQGGTDVVSGSMGMMQEAVNAANGALLPGSPWFQADSNFSTPALGDVYRNGRTEIVEGGDSTHGVAFGITYQNGGHVRVLNGAGGLICQYNTNQVVQSSPAIGQFLPGGAVGITVGTGLPTWPGASNTNQILGLTSNCGLAWAATLDGLTTSSPALARVLGNGQLQIAEGTDRGTAGGSVYLLDGATGRTIWHVPTLGRVIGGGIVTADLGGGYQDLVVASTGGLQILDGRSHQQLAAVHPSALQNSALVTNDPDGTIGITVAGYNNIAQGVVTHYEVTGSRGSLATEAGAWPMFHHDPQLTGNAGIAPPVIEVPCKPPSTTPHGYYLAASDGGIFTFGNLPYCGSTGSIALNQPIVGMAATPDAGGYWLVASDGGIFAFDDAHFHGSTGGIRLNQPIVGMAVDRATGGYWLVASDGGIFAFNAPFYGSTGGIRLNQPIVGMAATRDGKGYWLVARDGGIFTFGDARFHGSTGGIRLNQPVVGMAATPSGNGYWLVARDGGIFTFGDARFRGSTGGIRLNQPIVGMASDPATGGYWLVASDGGMFTFDAPFYGSTGGIRLNRPIVAAAGF
jgi:hypothetical protein